MATPRIAGPVGPCPEAAHVNGIVSALSALFGGGEVVAWALVTEQASVVGSRAEDGAPTITVGRVVDATAAVRRLVRARSGAR